MTSDRKPNVLIIMADQLRQDALGCYGNPDVKTPNIDEIASMGVRFDNAYTVLPLCSPARYSLLTGKYPRTLGLKTNNEFVAESTDNFVRRLHNLGYRTGCFGKMHFTPVYANYGFDVMRLAEQNGEGWKIDDYHKYLKNVGLTDWWDLWDQQPEYRDHAPKEYWQTYGVKGSDIPEEHYSTTWIANETIAFLEDLKGQEPFFAWTSFIKPHHPFDPPKPYDAMYDPDQITLPPNQENWRQKPLLTAGGRDPRLGYFDTRTQTDQHRRSAAAMYYGAISHIDYHVGRIINTLKEHGLLDNTIIILLADHGDYLGQFGLYLKHPNIPYDALSKVPLIIAAPGMDVKCGTSTKALVSLVDIYPTILSLVHAPMESSVEGLDLTPILMNPDQVVRDLVIVESEEVNALRTEQYKYLRGKKNGVEELYHLVDDPYELNNLAQDPAMNDILSMHRNLYREIFGRLPENWEGDIDEKA